MPHLEKIITLLTENESISDLQIMGQLQITKEKVLTYINKLECLGLKVNILEEGDRRIFQPFILLDLLEIQKGFTKKTFSYIKKIKLFNTISSTNEYLKKNIDDLTLVIAEEQTAGKGRLGRKWLSPFGCNIYLSLVWSNLNDLHEMNGLSIIVGLAVVNALQKFSSQKLSIKWPNDIICENKKMAGILIDVASKSASLSAIVGIGVNVNQAPSLPNAICLREVAEKYLNRNIIIYTLVNEVFYYIDRYVKYGLKFFLKEWHIVDHLYEKEITIINNKKTVVGKSLGIDMKGNLIVLNKNKKTIFFSSGDCSICK